MGTPTAATSAFTPDTVGRYQAQLIVTDNAGYASSPAIATIDVATCGVAAPTLDSQCLISGSCVAGTTFTSPVLQKVGATALRCFPNLYA